MRYFVISHWQVDDLIKSVNNYLDQGWEPLGPPFIKGYYFHQALVLSDLTELQSMVNKQ